MFSCKKYNKKKVQYARVQTICIRLKLLWTREDFHLTGAVQASYGTRLRQAQTPFHILSLFKSSTQSTQVLCSGLTMYDYLTFCGPERI